MSWRDYPLDRVRDDDECRRLSAVTDISGTGDHSSAGRKRSDAIRDTTNAEGSCGDTLSAGYHGSNGSNPVGDGAGNECRRLDEPEDVADALRRA